MSGTPGLNPRSGMISLDLPQGTVKPVPGGVDDHHVTVVYLGPDVDDAAFARACQRARDAAAGMAGPLKGSVAGVGSFPPSASSDGKRPAFAPVTLPGAKPLRSRLEDLSASEHKDWVPHVTLAYVGKDDPLPAAVPRTPVKFTHLSVHRGADVKRFPLGGGKAPGLANQARGVDLSALTPAYSSTPAPLGRPGGPGLWHNKSRKLPDYIENVARGIMQGGVADKSRAIATAIAAVRRWAAGGGKVSPEVRAAAAKAIAEWESLKASAHAHANQGGAVIALTWNGQSIDLGYMPPHVPAGSPNGGQFGTTSGKGTNSGGTAGKAQQQHAQHMAHVAHLQHLVATGKATPAQRQELGGLLKALKAKPKAALVPGSAAANEAAAAAAIAAHPLPNAPAKKKAAATAKAKAKAAPKATATAKKPAATAKTASTPNAPGKATTGTPNASVSATVKVSGTPAQRKAALHGQANADRVKAAGIDQQVASLNRVIAAQVKATAAAKAGQKLTPTAAAKAKAAIAKAAPKKAGNAATKAKAAPRATLAQNRATVKALTGQARSLRSQAGALDAQANAIRLSGDGGRFLDLAVADAITVPGPEVRRLIAPAERVPPGVREGGQFTPRPPQFTRHDTPERAAEVINSMGPAQRARVRATILCPPGYSWGLGDKLAVAELAHPG